MALSRFSLVLSIPVALSLVLASTGGWAAAQIYASEQDDGSSSSPQSLPFGPQLLHLWLDSGALPSAPGTACETGAGEETCVYQVEIEATGQLTLLGFTPAADEVHRITSTLLSVNGGNPADGLLGPVKLGDVALDVAGSGTVEVTGLTTVSASLVQVQQPVPVLVAVPEPGGWPMLAFGVAGLAGLAGLRARRARRKGARRLVVSSIALLLVGGWQAGGPSEASAQEVAFGLPAALNTNAATDAGNDEDVALATDGAGSWVAIWASLEDLGGAIGTDSDILVARSTDDGASWSAPAPLNSNASSSWRDASPALATDGSGTWIAVWASNHDLAGSVGGDYDILFSRSLDDGATWSAADTLHADFDSDLGDEDHAAIVVDGAGRWIVTWEGPIAVPGDAGIGIARSSNAGVTWTAPAVLTTNGVVSIGPDRAPKLATDGAGNWLVAWYQWESFLTPGYILVSRSTDAGVSWAPAALLHTSLYSIAPSVAHDGQGSWVIVWSAGDDLGGTIGPDDDILVSRSVDGGSIWTTAAPLNSTAAGALENDSLPVVAADGAGNLVAAWLSWNDLGGTIGTDRDVQTARSSDGGVTWSDAAALSPDAGVETRSDFAPVLETDALGRWLAASGTFADENDPSDSDLFFSTGVGPDRDADGLPDAAEVGIHATDPLDADSDDDGLLDGDEIVGPDLLAGTGDETDPLDEDSDDDTILDFDDTCPLDPLAAQADADGDRRGDACDVCGAVHDPHQFDWGGVGAASLPNGKGNVCECGDLDDTGLVTQIDVDRLRNFFVGSLPTPGSASKCDVWGSDGCDLRDWVVIARALQGEGPGIAAVCVGEAYEGLHYGPNGLGVGTSPALTLLGDATTTGGALRLTPSVVAAGAGWYPVKQDVAGGFDASFSFEITSPVGGGGEGLAFVIQNDSAAPVPSAGSSLGYGFLPNSLAIEFDTQMNVALGDPDDNHVSVHSNGVAANSPNESASLALAPSASLPDLSDGNVHEVRVEYVWYGGPVLGSLLVYVDDLFAPVIDVRVDLSSLLSLDAGRAWVGFTGATSAAAQTQEILAWDFLGRGL